MAREIFALIFLLTVGNLAYCQEWENLLFIKMVEMLEKQEAALSQLKGMQEKQEQVEGKLQEMQEKLQNVEINLQVIHQETKGCLGREDLEHFKNISSAGQELESSLRQGMSRVISLLETGGIDIDECTQGKDNCSPLATCKNSVGSYNCFCNPPFEGDGRTCEFPCKSPAKVFEGL
ncbi:uncharacterized protein LOC135204440 isoform X2 [Macrobrachium nipponense]|uniref:uncharacterized protein LOC135204440 isoform X2 n=1 Tax=Macrobrachium nipponense TaxID=159736 RepID=UPI0030C7C271